MSKNAQAETQWIWIDRPEEKRSNRYVDFRAEVELPAVPRQACLRVSADTNFVAWINAALTGCGQFSDFPDRRTYSEMDVTGLLEAGRNVIAALVHYCGVDHFSYIPGDAGLWYELEVDGRVVARSSEATLCRESPGYLAADTARLTVQMGFTFNYDASQDDNWTSLDYHYDGSWQRAVKTKQAPRPEPRPLKMLELQPQRNGEIVAQGVLKRETVSGETVADLMQRDFLSARRSWELFNAFEPSSSPAQLPVRLTAAELEEADGSYLVLDLGREEVGFPVLELNCTDGCVIDMSIGEHLDDLRVRSSIGGRHFASRYTARSGRQTFVHYFQRYAGRYLQLHITELVGSVELRGAGLIPSEYPVESVGDFRCGDGLCNQVWQTSVRTLHLCMHEHYEDCPWREQALYANDARNQMLCGYYVFRDHDFPRVSLELLARNTGPDGYQELCSPMKYEFLIPGFTMTWFLAMNDYLMYSGDTRFVADMFPQMKAMMGAYFRTLRNGVLPCPTGSRYWHFYDWAPGLAGVERGDCTTQTGLRGVRFDAPLNFLLIMALQASLNMAEWLQDDDFAQECRSRLDALRRTAHETFWVSRDNAYQSYAGDEAFSHYAELTQSLAILAGVGTAAIHDDLRRKLVDKDSGMTAATLSQSLYKYEAIIQNPSFGSFVSNDIAEHWSGILFAGATSFWETLNGAWDFNHAGSLCHGWSAIPVYFYGAYGLGVKPLAPGFARFAISPRMGMESVTGTVPSPAGNVEVSLKGAPDSYTGEFEVPDSLDLVVDRARVRQ